MKITTRAMMRANRLPSAMGLVLLGHRGPARLGFLEVKVRHLAPGPRVAECAPLAADQLGRRLVVAHAVVLVPGLAAEAQGGVAVGGLADQVREVALVERVVGGVAEARGPVGEGTGEPVDAGRVAVEGADAIDAAREFGREDVDLVEGRGGEPVFEAAPDDVEVAVAPEVGVADLGREDEAEEGAVVAE